VPSLNFKVILRHQKNTASKLAHYVKPESCSRESTSLKFGRFIGNTKFQRNSATVGKLQQKIL